MLQQLSEIIHEAFEQSDLVIHALKQRFGPLPTSTSTVDENFWQQ